MVVVGSFAGIALLPDVGELEVASAGGGVAAVGAADDATGVVAIGDVRAAAGVEDAKVWSAAAPVKVVKPAVGPLKVADIVTKMTDTALVG
jgi:hypothetical protein